MTGSTAPALLKLEGIAKRYGAVVANEAVDFAIAPGEIHALLGENGAGKSTLVKAIYGVIRPDAGRMLWDGMPITIGSPTQARAHGIGMVFQHFSLFEALTVAENIALAMPPGEPFASLNSRIASVAEQYGLPVDPNRSVHTLSVGERQRVEIVRVLLQNPRLLILDEPTSVLTPQEADRLFVTLRQIADEGRSVLYISHRLDEVRALCHNATILRHGKVVAACDPTEETARSLAALMVGSEVPNLRLPTPPDDAAPVRLAVKGLFLEAASTFAVALHDVSLAVKAGEILGIAGVAGNGQAELFEALSGERRTEKSAVMLDGVAVGDQTISERRERGAAFIPEERNGHGAVPHLKLSDNVVLSGHASGFAKGGFIQSAAALAKVADISDQFDVRKGGPDPQAQSLSGGNLQKFLVGREMLRSPSVLVVSQPTWGVDAGAAQLIRDAIVRLADTGAAVVVISQDLDELFELSHRISVLFHGRLSASLDIARANRESIGLLMGGSALSDLCLDPETSDTGSDANRELAHGA